MGEDHLRRLEEALDELRAMEIGDLHEVATIVKTIHQAIDRLLLATGPLQMQHYEARAAVRRTGSPEADDAAMTALWERDGYGAFWDAVEDLIGLLETVEEADQADARRRFTSL